MPKVNLSLTYKLILTLVLALKHTFSLNMHTTYQMRHATLSRSLDGFANCKNEQREPRAWRGTRLGRACGAEIFLSFTHCFAKQPYCDRTTPQVERAHCTHIVLVSLLTRCQPVSRRTCIEFCHILFQLIEHLRVPWEIQVIVGCDRMQVTAIHALRRCARQVGSNEDVMSRVCFLSTVNLCSFDQKGTVPAAKVVQHFLFIGTEIQ